MQNKGILAIDFDNTIAETTFPFIHGVKGFAAEAISGLRAAGWYIIINTCRSGVHEEQAKQFLWDNHIDYDLINENHPELCELFEYDCRKISADIYIDDKNLDSLLYGIDWNKIYWNVRTIGERKDFTSMLDLCKKEEA